MVQVNWTFLAKDDLKNIYDFISRDSKRYAMHQILRIKNRTHILTFQMLVGKVVPELNQKEIRELVEGNYRIIYKVVSRNRVDVLTVHHTSRDLLRRGLM